VTRFAKQIERCANSSSREVSILHPFLEAGLYYQQVKRYVDRFPRENIRIYWYEDDWRQPARMLVGLFAFLGVDTTFTPDTSLKSLAQRAPRSPAVNYLLKKSNIWPSMKGFVPPAVRSQLRSLVFRSGRPKGMDPKDRQYLIEYYRKDIIALSGLLGRD